MDVSVDGTARVHRRFATNLILVLTLLAPLSSFAQSNYRLEEKGAERLNAARKVAPLSADTLFGDRISHFNGNVTFRVTDVSVPGNNELPVELGRLLTIDDRRIQNGTHLSGFGEWDLDIPHLYSVVSQMHGWAPSATRCSSGAEQPMVSTIAPEDYWDGYKMRVRGGEQTLLNSPTAGLPSPSGTFPWITKELWRLGCKATTKNGYPGQAFFARSPDGLTYHFDWGISRPHAGVVNGMDPSRHVQRQVVYFLVTRVEDRFGNWVDYSYSGSKLTGISASDGRSITVTWSADKIASVNSSVGTWSYGYAGEKLTGVVQPDASQWSYSSTGEMHVYPPVWTPTYEDPTGCPEPLEPMTGDYSLTVNAPTGASATYTFTVLEHVRSNIPENACVILTPTYWYWKTPRKFSGLTLTSKVVTGHGMPTHTETFAYGGPGWLGSENEKENTVTESDGKFTLRRFGTGYELNEGQLLGTDTGTGPTAILRSEVVEYITDAEMPGQPFPNRVGWNPKLWGDQVADSYLRPVKRKTMTQQGATFKWQVNQFDALARPQTVLRQSTGTSSDASRTDVTARYDNAALYVLNQVATETNSNTGLVTSQVEYNAQALPWKVHRNSKLENTLTYNADSTVSSVADGKGNTISFANWKRGIPQAIAYPATAEAPSGSTESLVVSNEGWVTATTDENGFTTNYQYDPMGRVSRVDYPTGDSTGWLPTVISFVKSGSAAQGIPAGHWVRTETTGNRTEVTRYSGLWQPMLSERYDAANVAGTRSVVVNRYDAQGHEAFRSYPVASVADWGATLTGMRTQYDVLDRVTRVEQDSELGVLGTNTEYLTGLSTRVTDPRGAQTQTIYMAWDSPNFDRPTGINHPASRFTEIYRDVLGEVTAMRRRNASGSESVWRYFVYDAHRRMCKRIDPESGATVVEYDAANNTLWSATGLIGYADTTNCNRGEAHGSGRRVDLVYDARNRETQRTYPDGRGNTTTTYTPDNLISTKTAYNDPGNATPVVTTLTYNKRRMLTTESSSQPGWYVWSSTLAYDGYGNMFYRNYPNGLGVYYDPNALGQPTQVRTHEGQTLASGISYYPNGAIHGFTYGNGIFRNMTQNVRQLPTRAWEAGVMDLETSFDGNANPIAIIDHFRGSSYSRWMTYDLADRLTDVGSAMFGGDHWHRMSYDAIDNLKSGKLPGVKDYANYVYDSRNLPTQIQNTGGTAVVTQSFDVQGNLNNKNGQGYSFDVGNRLREVSGKEWSRYDGYGHRALRWQAAEAGILALYSHDGKLLYDDNYRAAVRTSHAFVQLQGSLLATWERHMDTGAVSWKYQHTDALGSPVAITNQAGAVVERNEWEPWGKSIGKPTMDTVGYTGHQMDGVTGNIYMQQRYYDPDTGQFLSVDPVYVDLKSGASFNRRWYANNNPYRFKDPDGRDVLAQLRAYVMGSAPIQGTYAHQYLYLRDTETGAEMISRAGPSAEYPGGASDVAFGSPVKDPNGDGNVTLVTELKPPSESTDADANRPGEKPSFIVKGSSVVIPGNIGQATAKLEKFNNKVVSAKIDYKPLSTNSNAYAGTAYTELTGKPAPSYDVLPGSDVSIKKEIDPKAP